MTRRTKKSEDALAGLAIIIALVVWGIGKMLDITGIVIPVIVFFGLIGLVIWYRVARHNARVAALRAKYGDEQLVQRILNHEIWAGQTAEQLIDSRGMPHNIDNKISRMRKREVWKYDRRGVNRYGLRITLDNDVVTEKDYKSY